MMFRAADQGHGKRKDYGVKSHIPTFTGIRKTGTTERIEGKSRSRAIDHGIHGKRQEIRGQIRLVDSPLCRRCALGCGITRIFARRVLVEPLRLTHPTLGCGFVGWAKRSGPTAVRYRRPDAFGPQERHRKGSVSPRSGVTRIHWWNRCACSTLPWLPSAGAVHRENI